MMRIVVMGADEVVETRRHEEGSRIKASSISVCKDLPEGCWERERMGLRGRGKGL